MRHFLVCNLDCRLARQLKLRLISFAKTKICHLLWVNQNSATKISISQFAACYIYFAIIIYFPISISPYLYILISVFSSSSQSTSWPGCVDSVSLYKQSISERKHIIRTEKDSSPCFVSFDQNRHIYLTSKHSVSIITSLH